MCEYYDTKAKIYQNLYKKKYFDDYIIYQDKKYVSLLARRFTILAVKNTEARLRISRSFVVSLDKIYGISA